MTSNKKKSVRKTQRRGLEAAGRISIHYWPFFSFSREGLQLILKQRHSTIFSCRKFLEKHRNYIKVLTTTVSLPQILPAPKLRRASSKAPGLHAARRRRAEPKSGLQRW